MIKMVHCGGHCRKVPSIGLSLPRGNFNPFNLGVIMPNTGILFQLSHKLSLYQVE